MNFSKKKVLIIMSLFMCLFITACSGQKKTSGSLNVPAREIEAQIEKKRNA